MTGLHIRTRKGGGKDTSMTESAQCTDCMFTAVPAAWTDGDAVWSDPPSPATLSVPLPLSVTHAARFGTIKVTVLNTTNNCEIEVTTDALGTFFGLATLTLTLGWNKVLTRIDFVPLHVKDGVVSLSRVDFYGADDENTPQLWGQLVHGVHDVRKWREDSMYVRCTEAGQRYWSELTVSGNSSILGSLTSALTQGYVRLNMSAVYEFSVTNGVAGSTQLTAADVHGVGFLRRTPYALWDTATARTSQPSKVVRVMTWLTDHMIGLSVTVLLVTLWAYIARRR